MGKIAVAPLGLSPAAAGTICCGVAALGYTAANVCMRQLAALGCDPTWATCNKEAVTGLVVGPWLLAELCRGRRILPPWPTVGGLVLVGLAVQLCGNLCCQWAMPIVGLAVNIPVIFGVMLVASALMGRVVLGERVTPRSMAAIGLLVVALVLLGLSAGTASRSIAAGSGDPPTTWLVALAIAAGCSAGVVYALLSTSIRRTVTRDTRLALLVFVITSMGVLTLGPLSLFRLGGEHLLATPAEHWALMLAAGTGNLVGFVAITKGLQFTTVVHANVLNASQVALAAIAGMLLFLEPPNPWLVVGVGLTVAGIVLIDRPVETI